MVCRSSRATSKRPFFMRDHGLVEQLLVRLLGVDIGQGIGAQILILLLLGLLLAGMRSNARREQQRKRGRHNPVCIPIHKTSLRPPRPVTPPAEFRPDLVRLSSLPILPVCLAARLRDQAAISPTAFRAACQQAARIPLRLACTEHSISGDEQLRSCLDDLRLPCREPPRRPLRF